MIYSEKANRCAASFKKVVTMFLLIVFHILAVVIWVGGMFFAYQCLRPVAAEILEPPLRLLLWRETFKRFFVWVWAAIIILLVSGHSMIAILGGMGSVGLHVHLMLAIAYVMIALYGYVYFVLFKRLKQATSENRWPEAGSVLNKIRHIIAVNLILGLITISVAAGGRYLV